MPVRQIVSCNQCAAISFCHDVTHLEAAAGRRIASRCSLPYKGRPSETVKVEGEERGISRKRAMQTVRRGRARFTVEGTVVLRAPHQLQIKTNQHRARIVYSWAQQEMQLIKQIEALRKELHAHPNGTPNPRLLEISRRLDRLITLYTRVVYMLGR